MNAVAGTSTTPRGFRPRQDLATAATSRDLATAPRHRWFYFPHSYSYRLVDAILDFWDLPPDAVVADNFAGSGTTLLAARQRDLSALGFDLSPLAVAASTAKIASYEERTLERALGRILAAAPAALPKVPHRLSRAFTDAELSEMFTLLLPIRSLRAARPFFMVAFLSAVGEFSRAVPDGGWFRWREWPDRSTEIRDAFKAAASRMMADVQALNWPRGEREAMVRRADARRLPIGSACIDGLITSPPYANRHDYSRVFHIELLLLGEAEPAVTRLRHRSIRSHVEAKPPRGLARRLEAYTPPAPLSAVLRALPSTTENRVMRFLQGYFEDLYLSLVEAARILRPGGRAAYVVGNVRHGGVMVPVDEITVELAAAAGLGFETAWVMRERGNAAQQMGRYGRQASRESVVLLSKAAGP